VRAVVLPQRPPAEYVRFAAITFSLLLESAISENQSAVKMFPTACLLAACAIGMSSAVAQDIFVPRVKKAEPVLDANGRAKTAPTRPHVAQPSPTPVTTVWETYNGPQGHTRERKEVETMVPGKFAVPMFLGTVPSRPFTILGYVYVNYRPQTSDPHGAAIQEMARQAKLHGADACSLRPRHAWQRWYAAGTAIRFR
jgi:hypothetical protein